MRVAANCFHTHLQWRINSVLLAENLPLKATWLLLSRFEAAWNAAWEPWVQETLWAGYLLAKHPKSQRHNETLGTSGAVNSFHFEASSRAWDGCTHSWCAAKDSDGLELVEIICLAFKIFFFQASPPRSCANPAVFSPFKRREDFKQKQKGAEGYFAEGMKFLLLWRFWCWEEGDRRKTAAILWWNTALSLLSSGEVMQPSWWLLVAGIWNHAQAWHSAPRLRSWNCAGFLVIWSLGFSFSVCTAGFIFFVSQGLWNLFKISKKIELVVVGTTQDWEMEALSSL